MKINIDEEGLELLQQQQDEPEPEKVVEFKKPKQPAWFYRAERQIRERQANSSRTVTSLPQTTEDHLAVAAWWFLTPLSYTLIGGSMEQAGYDMRGVAILTLCIAVGVGWWFYLSLLANSSEYLGIIWRIILVGLGILGGLMFLGL